MAPDSRGPLVVHVFAGSGVFACDDEARAYLEPRYTADGGMQPSSFMRESGLHGEYEPACIESMHSMPGRPLADLLRGVSYEASWLHRLDGAQCVNTVICVFPPNRPAHPEGCTLPYLGAFGYTP